MAKKKELTSASEQASRQRKSSVKVHWRSLISRHRRITNRIGIAFLSVTIAMLACAWVATTDNTLQISTPLYWLVTIAFCSFAGLVSMRTARTLRIVEDELLRYTAASDIGEVNAVARTPRRILAEDPICDGWNRLLDLALSNASSDTEHRAVAPLDREAVTLARAMRGLPVAWVITDADAKIRFVSPVALGLLGIIDEAKHEGRNLLELLRIEPSTEPKSDRDPDFRDDYHHLLGPVRMVTVRRDLTIAGSVIKLRIVRSRMGGRTGDGAGIAWVLHDVTQQQLATEARDQFLMTATHEFRTPLNNLQAYAEALNKQDGLNVEHQKEFCNIIYTEANRLGRLVDHLLTVSQMEAGSIVIHRHELELLPMLGEILEQNAAPAQQKEIKLTHTLPAKLPTVLGDRDKLQAAILNVVGNAIKYTPDGGDVTVHCTVENTWIRIDVIDSGLGIPPDEQTRVFEKFFRGQQAIQSTDRGNGLGLAFTREVVRMHDGDITLESNPGQGSMFTIRLPIGGQSRSGV